MLTYEQYQEYTTYLRELTGEVSHSAYLTLSEADRVAVLADLVRIREIVRS